MYIYNIYMYIICIFRFTFTETLQMTRGGALHLREMPQLNESVKHPVPMACNEI